VALTRRHEEERGPDEVAVRSRMGAERGNGHAESIVRRLAEGPKVRKESPVRQRKLTLPIMGLLLAGLALQACSSAASPSPSASAPSAAPPASAAASAAASPEASPSPSPSQPNGGQPVTISLWHNYGTEANTTATENLVKAYEALHPNVTIDVVSQPAANYFPLLTAAAISKTGPCLATMWTGLFMLQNKDYLEKLSPTYIPEDTLKKFSGIEWGSDNFNPDNGVYVVPLELQFYNGFYNKDLFAKAGITTLPTNWQEFNAAAAKLKAAGIQPMVYGSGAQAILPSFYPWYDFSYLMTMVPVADWQKLYTGDLAFTDPTIVAATQKWVDLFKSGYTNKDVLSDADSWKQFLSGKAAMTLEGTWGISDAEKQLGSKAGVFLPAFTDQALNGVVQFPGDGFAMTSYCQHKDVAADFLSYMTTMDAQKIISDAGLIPGLQGATTSDPLSQDLLSYAATKNFAVYPMLDNVLQPEVVNTGNKTLPAAFAGTMSAADALKNMQDTLMALPADRRSSSGYK
jgi:raffinose/stachyose/melibiose transport system substrate-binding protein